MEALLKHSLFLSGSTDFEAYVPVSKDPMRITAIWLRSKDALPFAHGQYTPLSFKSPQLKWNKSKVENAREANVWFHPSVMVGMNNQLLKADIENARPIKLEIPKGIYKDIEVLEKTLGKREPNMQSVLSMDEGRSFISTKLKKNVTVFEVKNENYAKPSSMVDLMKEETVKVRPLIRVTGVFLDNRKEKEMMMKICTVVEQLHWSKPSRKRVRGSDRSTNLNEADRITHFNVTEWNRRITNFGEEWLNQQAAQLDCFTFTEKDGESISLDDTDIIVDTCFREDMHAIIGNLFDSPDLIDFLAISSVNLEFEQGMWNQEYQTQPEDWRCMRRREMILRYHRDLLNFMKPVILAFRLHRLCAYKRPHDELSDEAKALLNEKHSEDLLGKHQFLRMNYANSFLRTMLQHVGKGGKDLMSVFEEATVYLMPEASIGPFVEILADLYNRQQQFETARLVFEELASSHIKRASPLFKKWQEAFNYWKGSFGEHPYGVHDPRHRLELRRIMANLSASIHHLSLNGPDATEASRIQGQMQNELDLLFSNFPEAKRDFDLPLFD